MKKLNFNYNSFRLAPRIFGGILTLFLIEVTRHYMPWFLGLIISLLVGLLVSFILENL